MLVDGLAGRASAPRTETKSSPTDLVTAMDRAVEVHLRGRILDARPHDAVLGEEGGARTGTTGVTWVLDPIDGTVNYVFGLPGFAVSVAAVDEAGRGLVGVVVDPLQRDTYLGVAGEGARRNGRAVHVRPPTPLGQALVATGFSYEAERRARQAAVLTRVLPAVRDIRRFGAASVDLCNVAAGRLDGYWEKGLHPWDLAAGVLIATEAGAVVGDARGGVPSGDFCLAATPSVYPLLAALLDEAGALHA